ncbi:ATP-binding cassette, subfamily B (MDR/TAP), member 1 [Rasamsonia emersonii CBS 393.64]|uniref:ATP-binding cassette, subfamily B (MDR/TAP), member 1 n=1 Tax=Rasamsonia emersonii (strain ATCC 16479 / CBS 393.64 / IMI 116815) TaxID=1408163 RepID=A0A0F4Z2P8_RASE3|nr:ATP-binding cassette, subfamily B (MDR/TAP), member 1 [Rasamsonia emersonii CBS 393.64]KKA24366.1 ATP-binding cassette, subfamily B (MDR/TAP), member 1 [Rasamsonia emersonii CBS 393.64]
MAASHEEKDNIPPLAERFESTRPRLPSQYVDWVSLETWLSDDNAAPVRREPSTRRRRRAESSMRLSRALSQRSRRSETNRMSWVAAWDAMLGSVPPYPEEPQPDPEPIPLTDEENERLRTQIETRTVSVGLFALYRYATRNDRIVLLLSALGAVAGGAVMPLMPVIFGSLAGQFADLERGTMPATQFSSALGHRALYYVYLAVGEFVLVYGSMTGFLYAGDRIASTLRRKYLAAILRQNIGYFDDVGVGEVTHRLCTDIDLVQEAIAEKVALTLGALATFLAAFVVGFVESWRLTLICSCTVVAMVLVTTIATSFTVRYNQQALAASAVGSSLAEEILASIRVVFAFGAQEKLAQRYAERLVDAERWGVRLKSAFAVMIGFMLCFLFLNYGLAFWMGARFLVAGDITLSEIITIILAIIMGAFALGQVGPNLQAMATGVAAAAKIYSTIDRFSPIDAARSDETGARLDAVAGTIELRDIRFAYPSRPEVLVLDRFSLTVPAGRTIALVGLSGSGKSTICGLIERFYDPVGGQILLDGHDIRDLNLRWLRQQMAFVQQDPVLFNDTVYNNIRDGLIGSPFDNDKDPIRERQRIVAAAKKVHAHGFIMALPHGYETRVGDRGALLSGGQRQRIALARAVVRDPKILLMDEATSALDTKSETLVQDALQAARRGRTTIVIAHRLSTIRDADEIVVMKTGRIVERGTHDELLRRGGAYADLVRAQRLEEQRNSEREMNERNSAPETYEMNNDSLASFDGRLTSDTDALSIFPKGTDVLTLRPAEDEEDDSKKTGSYSLGTLIRFIASFNRPEWLSILVGLLFNVVAGGGQPTQGVFFSETVVALSSNPLPQFADRLRAQVDRWARLYLMLGLVQLAACVVQGVALAHCSERLIRRARDMAFRVILAQDIAYFDERPPGELTTLLATEVPRLAGISGLTLGTLLSCATTLVAAVVIALAVGWKLALVTSSTIPVILGCGFFRFWALSRIQVDSQRAYRESASYASENINAIRTVVSLTKERRIQDEYAKQLARQQRKSLRAHLRNAALYAASQSLLFLCIALGFWYGGRLLADREYSLLQFYICLCEIIFSVQSAGIVFSYAGDMGKAKSAAAALKTLFDRRPVIETAQGREQGPPAPLPPAPYSPPTPSMPIPTLAGAVDFRSVYFAYPQRPDIPVLRGLTLSIRPGQFAALVGASGSGKSTVISLLERFYDPQGGAVYVDGQNVATFNVNQYRSHLALVAQEPALYQGTIKENILLGWDGVGGETGQVQDRVVEACKEANIYDFIMSLP